MKALKAYFEKDWWDAKNNETKLFKQPLIMFPEKTGLGENNNIAILTINSDGKQVTVDDIYLKVVDDWGEDVDNETREKLEKLMTKFSDNIDWEQRRYEVARNAMNKLSCDVLGKDDETMSTLSDMAIDYAEAFLSKLKEREQK